MAGTDANVGISLWDEERSWTVYNFQNLNQFLSTGGKKVVRIAVNSRLRK